MAREVRAVGAALAAAPSGWGGGKRGGVKPLPYLFLVLTAPALAQDRAISFWPDAVPPAIHAEVDGVAALETVRELGRYHRVQGSPGFAAAAELMKQKAVAAGLSDAAIERFPADGRTKYAHFGTPEWVAKLWSAAAPAVAADVQRLRAELPPAARPADSRIPTRSPEIVGPINVSDYHYLADVPGADDTRTELARRDDGDVLAYEALNLADGTRSISEIRDALSRRYEPAPLSAIAEYFELLAKAGAVRLQ